MSGRRSSRRAGGGGEAGYTLLEMMSVIAILALLMSILIYGIGKYRVTAYEKGTKALLENIRSALEAYRAEYGEYPPDGFSVRPGEAPATRMAGGTSVAIRGSACLVYFLGMPTVQEIEVGEDVRKKIRDPFLELKSDMLSGDGDLDAKLADPTTEIVDPFGNPIHYDRLDLDPTSREPRIDDQTSPATHTMKGLVADVMHGPDPRRKQGGGLETKNAGTYDLWSHGKDVHDPTDDITNWKD